MVSLEQSPPGFAQDEACESYDAYSLWHTGRDQHGVLLPAVMRAFNDYWCRQLPQLRPTAGYSQDARRFKKQIAALQTALGIDDRQLWRSK